MFYNYKIGGRTKRLITFIFLIFLSCGLFKKEEEPMPLAVDNWWAYQTTTRGPFASKGFKFPFFQKFSKSPGTYIDTLKIIGTQTIEGVEGYVVFSSYKKDTVGIYYYKNDYLWLYDPKNDINLKFFPEKPKIGNKWISYEKKEKTYDLDGDGREDSVKNMIKDTIITKENISVPAGIFKDCYLTQWRATYSQWHSSTNQWQIVRDTLVAKFWIKTGMGTIKVETNVTQELTGYKVK
ncbi:MAG: hypothetical protein NZ608_07430 [candidate division WOR-3 bacterium]|nr:hypothetical protein [candidate division WOR-3 bacterium]